MSPRPRFKRGNHDGQADTPGEAGGLSEASGKGGNTLHVDQAEGPARAVRRRAERGPDGSAGLPCQYRNNSHKTAKRYRMKRLPGSDGFFVSKDNERAVWKQLDGDTLQRWGTPSSAERKSAFHLRKNVESFTQHWGRNHCLFFTITDKANLHPTEFARCWNHYLRRQGAWMTSFIRVLEPQKQGRPHYLCSCRCRGTPARRNSTGWHSTNAKLNGKRAVAPLDSGNCERNTKHPRRRNLPPAGRCIEKFSHVTGSATARNCCRYGKEAISDYVGKYLEAGLVLRRHSWKGARRVEFDRRAKNQWLVCTRNFSWHSIGASAWRQRIGEVAPAIGVVDMEGIRRLLGPKWAYSLRGAITSVSEEEWTGALGTLGQYSSLCKSGFTLPVSAIAAAASRKLPQRRFLIGKAAAR